MDPVWSKRNIKMARSRWPDIASVSVFVKNVERCADINGSSEDFEHPVTVKVKFINEVIEVVGQKANRQ